MTTEQLLEQAWNEAQARFRAMLDAKSYSDPEAFETRAYVAAERVVDDLLGELQWEASKAEWDRLQADDEHAGDHFRYPTEEALDELVRMGIVEEVPR